MAPPPHCSRNKKKHIRTSKELRRLMKTYHRKDDIPDCESEVHEQHEQAHSEDDERYLEELVNRRKRKIRRICVSPSSSLDSIVVTAISLRDGEVSASRHRVPQCHCSPSVPGHQYYGGRAAVAAAGAAVQPMQHDASLNGDPAHPDDSYSMFGDHRSYDNEALTRWSSSLFNWVYALFNAVMSFGEHIVRTPFLLGLTLTTIFAVIIAAQIEVLISYLIEEFLNVAYPAFHGYLLLLENWFTSAAQNVAAFNDLSQATYCDTADRWCTHYGVLCEQRCSFQRLAAERVRGSLR